MPQTGGAVAAEAPALPAFWAEAADEEAAPTLDLTLGGTKVSYLLVPLDPGRADEEGGTEVGRPQLEEEAEANTGRPGTADWILPEMSRGACGVDEAGSEVPVDGRGGVLPLGKPGEGVLVRPGSHIELMS